MTRGGGIRSPIWFALLLAGAILVPSGGVAAAVPDEEPRNEEPTEDTRPAGEAEEDPETLDLRPYQVDAILYRELSRYHRWRNREQILAKIDITREEFDRSIQKLIKLKAVVAREGKKGTRYRLARR